MQNQLFVYGTLGPGRPNAHILEALDGQWSEAYVIGRLVDAGWGAKAGFPALVLDGDGEKIAGYLFKSDSLPENWSMLDAFEGDEYERVSVEVTVPSSGAEIAQVYVLKA